MKPTRETNEQQSGAPLLRHKQFSLRRLFGIISVAGVILALTNHWVGGALLQQIASPIVIAAVIVGFLMLVQLPLYVILRETGLLPSPEKNSPHNDSTPSST